METLSLLKYWRGTGSSGVGNGAVSLTPDTTTTTTTTTTTIVTAAKHHLSESDDAGDDEGPFFDLEFSEEDVICGHDKHSKENNNKEENEEEEEDCAESDCESESELKFTVASTTWSDESIDHPNVSLSPSDDLFFKGRLLPLSEPNNNNTNPIPVSLLKSAAKSTKVGVMMLKFKKSSKSSSKCSKHENPIKADEVPIVSFFTRDYSSKGGANYNNNNNEMQQNVARAVDEEVKGFSKDVMQKYLKKVKPLYVRVSKFGVFSEPGAETESGKVSEGQGNVIKSERRGSLPGGFRVVTKHLGKGRSATVTAAAATSPPGAVVSKRRDDSLLQQQDGIQSAILHCKRSFKASRDMEAAGKLEAAGDELQAKSGLESATTEKC